MNLKEKPSNLEEQYEKLFKGSPQEFEEEPNLEQPYVGRIVPTVTTYSVSDKPELIQS